MERQKIADAEARRLQDMVSAMQHASESASRELSQDRARLKQEQVRLQTLQDTLKAETEVVRCVSCSVSLASLTH